MSNGLVYIHSFGLSFVLCIILKISGCGGLANRLFLNQKERKKKNQNKTKFNDMHNSNNNFWLPNIIIGVCCIPVQSSRSSPRFYLFLSILYLLLFGSPKQHIRSIHLFNKTEIPASTPICLFVRWASDLCKWNVWQTAYAHVNSTYMHVKQTNRQTGRRTHTLKYSTLDRK